MRRVLIKFYVVILSTALMHSNAFAMSNKAINSSSKVFTAADGTIIHKKIKDGKLTTTVTTSDGAVRTIIKTKNRKGDNKIILKTHSGKINDPEGKIAISSIDKSNANKSSENYHLAQAKKTEEN